MDNNQDVTKDRRAHLAGISKPTFMAVGAHSVGEDFAGMLYDMLRDLKACQIQQNKKCDSCAQSFDNRYLKKVHKKVPLSWPELVAFVLIVGAAVAVGVVDVQTILGLLRWAI